MSNSNNGMGTVYTQRLYSNVGDILMCTLSGYSKTSQLVIVFILTCKRIL